MASFICSAIINKFARRWRIGKDWESAWWWFRCIGKSRACGFVSSTQVARALDARHCIIGKRITQEHLQFPYQVDARSTLWNTRYVNGNWRGWNIHVDSSFLFRRVQPPPADLPYNGHQANPIRHHDVSIQSLLVDSFSSHFDRHYFTDRFNSLGCNDEVEDVLLESLMIYKSNEVEVSLLVMLSGYESATKECSRLQKWLSRHTNMEHSQR